MENTIKAIVAFLILGVVMYVVVQILPIYMDHWNLEDEIKDKVQYAFAAGGGDVEKRLKKEILESLKAIGAEYQEKDIKVTVKRGTKKIIVEVWYARSHNLPILQNPKQFYLHVENAVVEGL